MREKPSCPTAGSGAQLAVLIVLTKILPVTKLSSGSFDPLLPKFQPWASVSVLTDSSFSKNPVKSVQAESPTLDV